MLLSVATAAISLACCRDRRTLGIAIVAMIRIMATTISSSNNEKPEESRVTVPPQSLGSIHRDRLTCDSVQPFQLKRRVKTSYCCERCFDRIHRDLALYLNDRNQARALRDHKPSGNGWNGRSVPSQGLKTGAGRRYQAIAGSIYE